VALITSCRFAGIPLAAGLLFAAFVAGSLFGNFFLSLLACLMTMAGFSQMVLVLATSALTEILELRSALFLTCLQVAGLFCPFELFWLVDLTVFSAADDYVTYFGNMFSMFDSFTSSFMWLLNSSAQVLGV
jgi:hypothetical protein